MLTDLFSLGVTAKSLRAKRDRKSVILLQGGHFDPKFQVEGVAPPPIIFARWRDALETVINRRKLTDA